MFEEARKLGDRLVVILNNDNWLRTKKGFVFMPETERAEIIEKFPFVDEVYITRHIVDDTDRSVCAALEVLKPDIFANGGDRRNESEIPESVVCEKYGIKMAFGIGFGGKVQSSSWLTNAIKDTGREMRPWGQFRVLDAGDGYWIKTLTVNPKQRLSLQSHKERSEIWVCIRGTVLAEIGEVVNGKAVVTETRTLAEGEQITIPQGAVHRLSSATGGVVAEIALGRPTEADIERFEDDYKRI